MTIVAIISNCFWKFTNWDFNIRRIIILKKILINWDALGFLSVGSARASNVVDEISIRTPGAGVPAHPLPVITEFLRNVDTVSRAQQSANRNIE